MFFIDLLPAPNNKDIFNVEFSQQCKILFVPPRHSRNIAQCANCQRYGHTKNFCHLKPRCVKCAGDHSTSQCFARNALVMPGVFFLMELTLPTTRDVRFIRTSKKTYTALRPKQYTPPAPLQQTMHTQPGITYAQITKPNTCTPTPQDTAHLPTQSQQPLGDIQDLKLLLKTMFEQHASMLNLLNAVLSKIP
jgi:hypothetical protein